MNSSALHIGNTTNVSQHHATRSDMAKTIYAARVATQRAAFARQAGRSIAVATAIASALCVVAAYKAATSAIAVSIVSAILA